MRGDLRLADLERRPSPSKLMNVKIPTHVSDAIDRAVEELGCSKTAVVIALLNEGLDVAQASLAGFRPPVIPGASPRRKRGPRRKAVA